jgi:hypothetical protein
MNDFEKYDIRNMSDVELYECIQNNQLEGYRKLAYVTSEILRRSIELIEKEDGYE